MNTEPIVFGSTQINWWEDEEDTHASRPERAERVGMGSETFLRLQREISDADVVIIDLGMPATSGLEMVSKLENPDLHVPGILVTVKALGDFSQSAPRPIRIEELLDFIRPARADVETDRFFDRVESWYAIEDRSAVIEFLRSDRAAVEMLSEAIKPLCRSFGPNPQVTLRLFDDPEDVDDRQIVAVVKASADYEDACDSLDRFDEDWLDDNLYRCAERLVFTLEFD